MLQIRIRGVGRLVKGMVKLPSSVSKMTEEETNRTMKNIQKSAKLMAPRWTGKLAESISLTKPKRGRLAKQWILRVGAPYGIFWEEGFKPHRVRADRSTRSGFRVVDWMADKGLDITGGPLMVGMGKGRRNPSQFVRPAFQKHIAGFDKKLDRAVKKAIKESFA